jgi:hypothetical protein
MGTVTLQTIFQDAYPLYAQTHPLPAAVRRAARAVMQCRTAALGGHVHAGPDGPIARVWYTSCRHRSCPQGASLQPARWLARQRARLLACDHSHVLCTLPHDLTPLWRATVPLMTTLLFPAVRHTRYDLLGDPKYLGAHPGSIAALHTWSQPLVLHPHVHCLVTGGGLTPAGQWVAVRHGFLLPVRVGDGGVAGHAAGCHPPGLGTWGTGPARRVAAAAGAAPAPPAGTSAQDALERVEHGALPARSRCGDGSGALLARWPPPEYPAGGLGWGPRHLSVSHARGGGCVRDARVVTDDLAGRGLSATVAAACTGPPDPDGPLLGAVPSHPHGGLGGLPGTDGPATRGRPSRTGLADGVCPAGRRAPGTVSGLRATARMHGGPPLGSGHL